jgi:hypothetical protein
MPKRLSILSERLAVLAAVAAVILALCVGVHIHGSLSEAWKMFGLPALSPLFADTRTITHSIDCLLRGQDPFMVRTFDPWHRLYNYPPIWLDLRYLGVTSRSSNLLGSVLALMTLITFLLLFRARTWLTSVIVFLAVTSKAILFAVERGNTDQMIFFLLVVGFFLIDRQKTAIRNALKSVLIVCLTVLKIFPVAAAVVLVRNRKSTLTALLTALLSIAALKLTSGSHLPLVLGNTPQDTFVSFGAFPLFVAVFRHISGLVAGIVQHHVKISSIGALLLAVLSVAAGIHFREQLNRFLPPSTSKIPGAASQPPVLPSSASRSCVDRVTTIASFS